MLWINKECSRRKSSVWGYCYCSEELHPWSCGTIDCDRATRIFTKKIVWIQSSWMYICDQWIYIKRSKEVSADILYLDFQKAFDSGDNRKDSCNCQRFFFLGRTFRVRNDWEKKWLLSFNFSDWKCKVLHIGPKNPRYVESEKDSGIYTDEVLKAWTGMFIL